MNQYSELLGLVTLLKEKMLIENEPVEKCFIENTNINDWASFFREYDVFKYATFEKNWSNKRIRAIRKLMNSVFPENPENRSYKTEEDFDTLMMTILKEESELDKLECYIEEYLNKNEQLCARIRDKKSGKKVELIGDSFCKKSFFTLFVSSKDKYRYHSIYQGSRYNPKEGRCPGLFCSFRRVFIKPMVVQDLLYIHLSCSVKLCQDFYMSLLTAVAFETEADLFF